MSFAERLPKGPLPQEHIQALYSDYLMEGFAKERFLFKEVLMDGFRASALVTMTSTAASSTDPAGFHLSTLMAISMIGQLVITHSHILCGFKRKEIEVWMRDYSIIHRRPIRDPKNIRVEIRLEDLRKLHSSTMACLAYSISMGDRAVTAKCRAFLDFSKKQPSDAFLKALDTPSKKASQQPRP